MQQHYSMKRTNFLVLALLFIFLPIACTGKPDINTIKVEMGDFYFKPETIHLKSGQYVKIEIINEGKLEHEFMAGRMLTLEGEVEKQEMPEGEHKHQEEIHEKHEKKHGLEGKTQVRNNLTHVHSATFENDFFEGVEVSLTLERGKFIKVAGRGTMLILEPGGNATLSFLVPDDSKGEWETACFIPGHYEANMRGKIVVE